MIICARNARIHLERNLEAFLMQSYPEFELILVDDGSNDHTEEWVKSQQAIYPGLTYLRNQKTTEGKKQALSLGIANARYNWIALSDADCRPSSNLWLSTMMSERGPETEIILGYAPYTTKAGWLNRLIRFETLLNALQYLSASETGIPYMGTGRNLIYHKTIFDPQALQAELAYGDDDLLISRKANATNTAICIASDSFVYSGPSNSYETYFKQKWRHYATSNRYSPSIKLYLIVFFASFMAFHISLFGVFISKSYWIGMGSLLIYLSISWPLFCKQCQIFKEKNLCMYYPVLNLIYLIHLVIQFPFLWIEKRRW